MQILLISVICFISRASGDLKLNGNDNETLSDTTDEVSGATLSPNDDIATQATGNGMITILFMVAVLFLLFFVTLCLRYIVYCLFPKTAQLDVSVQRVDLRKQPKTLRNVKRQTAFRRFRLDSTVCRSRRGSSIQMTVPISPSCQFHIVITSPSDKSRLYE